MGHLEIDERRRPVEPHHGAIIEAHLFALRQVDPLDLREPLLLDQPGVQREQRLRPAGVQPGVTAVDVDGDGGIVERRETRRQQRAVELLGRSEESGDRDLLFASLLRRVQPGGRVDADRAGGEQRLSVVGPPLDGLGPLLTIREGDGERRRVAVALQIHPVPADPQRVIDLQPVGPPGVAGEVGPGLVIDIRSERRGLPGGQVPGLEVVDPHTHRIQRRSVDAVSGPKRVVGGR